jgi:2-oxo-hept-3-ene-1,7-dioate hydratase
MGVLTEDEVAALARRHRTARQEVQAIGQPSLDRPDLTIDDAYAAQRAWIDLELEDGRSIIGHKVGLTSQAMQTQMQIDEPDYGTLLDDMVFPDGADLAADRFIDPRLEVELAFVLGRPLVGAGVDLDAVLDATDYVVPAFELIDARSHRVDPATKRPRTIVDTIADNAANAGIVTGGRRVRPRDVDLRWVGALLSRNGEIEETGLAAGVLGHPANGVAWLARTLGARGVALEPGQVVLAGSFTRAVAARAGDTFHADFGPHGHIALHFH